MIKDVIKSYFDMANPFTYLLLTTLFVIISVLIAFGIINSHNKKRLIVAIVISIALVLISPVCIQILNTFLVNNIEIKITENKRLQYLDTILISGHITNTSIRKLKGCIVVAKTKKKPNNIQESARLMFASKITKQKIAQTIPKNHKIPFHMTVDNLQKDRIYTSSIKADCY